jgi:hypothetical protein
MATERKIVKMYRIKLKNSSKKEYDEILEFEDKDKAQFEYWNRMKGNYFYGSLNKVVNNKEENWASFCKSEFA